MGKCPECGEWNSFVEEVGAANNPKVGAKSVATEPSAPKKINEVEQEIFERTSSGISEFDRVMGGGITKGSLILIGGEPGIGKSTLLTSVMGNLVKSPHNKVLYVSGEESAAQIASRAKRLGVKEDNLYLYHETSWTKVVEQIKKIRPNFLVIDSIQTTISENIPNAPGTVGQIREVTYEIMNVAKSSNITCFVIGHITKEGTIAGPKILEHMVDTVIYFDGDQFGHYRILRAIKNRFGNTNEVGIFEMRENGLAEVPNPSQYFLEQPLPGSFGRALTCIVEGTRPLFVEIQSLVVENKFGNGRRTTHGIDSNRLAMLVAVVEKYFSIPLVFHDVYLNIVGGMKLNNRESDLSVIASLLSSYRTKPISNDTIFLGEVGLTGEVRSLPMAEGRIREAAKLSYKRVISSHNVAEDLKHKFKDVEIVGIRSVRELEKIL